MENNDTLPIISQAEIASTKESVPDVQQEQRGALREVVTFPGQNGFWQIRRGFEKKRGYRQGV